MAAMPSDCPRHAVQPSRRDRPSPRPIINRQKGVNEDGLRAEQWPIPLLPRLETVEIVSNSSSTTGYRDADVSPTNGNQTMSLQPTRLDEPEPPASPTTDIPDGVRSPSASDPGCVVDDDDGASTCSFDTEEYIKQHCVQLQGKYYYSSGGKTSIFPIDSDDPTANIHQDAMHRATKVLLDEKSSLTEAREKAKEPHISQGKILDVGTGLGLWAIEFADDNPAAIVYGVDFRPHMPTIVPPNAIFEVEDVDHPDWQPRRDLNFAFCRGLEGQIGDWTRMLTKIYDALKPDGRLEIQVMVPIPRLYGVSHQKEESCPKEHPISRLMGLFGEACGKSGCVLDVAPMLTEWLESAGFSPKSIQRTEFKLPLRVPGEHKPKSVAEEHKLNSVAEEFRRGFLSMADAIAAEPLRKTLKVDPPVVELLKVDVKMAVWNDPIYFDYAVFTASKMRDEETWQ